MPAAFAHLTLANQARDASSLNRLSAVSDQAKYALKKWPGFVDLGAVSPDLPYLALHSSGAKEWADRMHIKSMTGAMICTGIEFANNLDGKEKEKTFAWLCGYVAHVGMDMTIHPVVELKVGPYEGHEREHRICEMHQDVHIYPRLNLGDIHMSEYLDAGIARCKDPGGGLDRAVTGVWREMFKAGHPEEFKQDGPDIDAWHTGFCAVLDGVEEGQSLWPMARHVAANILGMTYPESANDSFIRGLETPTGRKDYDEIFDFALENVLALWELVYRGVYESNIEHRQRFTVWNLDNGRDESGNYVMWG